MTNCIEITELIRTDDLVSHRWCHVSRGLQIHTFWLEMATSVRDKYKTESVNYGIDPKS
jgi:hypothetical protein